MHADDPDAGDPKARTTLDAEALEQSAGLDLAETVGQVPGVTLARGTADAAKPIIRGQQERRLLVLFDGVRHESQKWGPDHATEIDPFSAGEITVVRGAAGARYGPDAIGGVILVEPPPMRAAIGVGGLALATFATNGLRPQGALRVDAVPKALPSLALRVEGNVSRGASLSTPDYVLGNTASEQIHLGASAQLGSERGWLRVSWHRYDLRAGIFYGVTASTPDAFETQRVVERPVGADLWTTSYAIGRPRQEVSHDQVSVRGARAGDFGELALTYAFQLNRRREFEPVRQSVTGPQFDFTLRTHSLDGAYTHPVVRALGAGLRGAVGVQGSVQENVYRGLPLLPNYRSFAAGVFGFERLAWGRVDLEVGARYDRLSRAAFLTELDHEEHLRRGTLDPETCEPGDALTRCPAAYGAGSATIGGVAHAVPDVLDLKLELSTASRFPNIDELYLAGTAPSLPVYAIGAPELGPETSWGGSGTVGLRLPGVEGEASVFGSLVDDYVLFAPLRNPDGSVRFEVTVRGAWPTFDHTAVDALLYGTDGMLTLGPQAVVGLGLSGALVRAQTRDGGDPLVGTPADQLSVEGVVRPGPVGPLHRNELAAGVDWIARQTRVSDADLAPAPEGVVLLRARVSTHVRIRSRELRVGIEGHNLLDAAYRDYTSLLRYTADQPGRDVRLRVSTDL